MPVATPEEISAWSAEEIRAEIQGLLPAGWKVASDQDNGGFWYICIERPGEEGSIAEIEEAHADERMALLNVFGRLWLKRLPAVGEESPWRRRQDLSRAGVTAAVSRGSSIPDPGDLDPNEIATVYEPFRKT